VIETEAPATAAIALRSDAVAWTRSGDEVVVLDLRSSSYLGVNASAVHLWLLLVEGTTEDAMVTALCEAYDIATGTAAQDVAAFLDELRRRELLTSV
jgi:hypothetical protein